MISFAKYLNFAKIKGIMYFAKSLKCFRKTAKFEFFAKQIIYLAFAITCFKMIIICWCSKSLKFFRTSKNGLNSAYFAKDVHKIAKSKYFPDILNDSDSPINSLSNDI